MPTVQHVVTAAGAPSAAPPSAGAHYINTTTGDHYLARGVSGVEDWEQLALRSNSAAGPTAMMSLGGLGAPVEPPTGPSIYVAYGSAPYTVHIAVYAAGETWEWAELTVGGA